MSMLSSMCTRLRAIADTLDVDGRTDEAHAVRDAADTLWELRCKLSGTVDEQQEYEATLADLRYRLAESKRSEGILYDIIGDMYHPDAYEKLKAENEKLKQLVRDMNKVAHMLCEAWEGSCDKEAEGMSLHRVCPIGDTSELCVFGRLGERMQELGIEVQK